MPRLFHDTEFSAVEQKIAAGAISRRHATPAQYEKMPDHAIDEMSLTPMSLEYFLGGYEPPQPLLLHRPLRK